MDLHCLQIQLFSGFDTFSVNTGMMGLFKRHIYKIIQMCVCVPILVTTFPEWLSGTEPLPHTPGAVRPSSSCM